MADEPFFPPPRRDEATAYRTPDARPEEPERRAPVVAHRADPPEEMAALPEGGKRAPPLLTPEEVRSLLVTTEAASSPRALVRCARRSVFFVPVGLIRTVARTALGDYATIVSLALFAAILVWVSMPLWQKDKDGWL